MEYTFEEIMEWSFSSTCMVNLGDWSKPPIFDEELELVLKVNNLDSQSSNGYV